MEDVTARIVIAAEAGKSLKEISQVENGLNKIYDSRQKDLMLAQAKAKLELAEYKSMTAAQAAYNAEIHKEGALKRLNYRKSRGADADEIAELTKQYQALNGQYLKLAQAESTANLAAYNSKVQYDNLSQALENLSTKSDKVGNKTKDLTGRISASRAASRLFGLDIDNGMNPALLKAGIIAAGVIATLKILRFSYDQFLQKAKDAADFANMTTSSILNANSFKKEGYSKDSSYLDSLRGINEQEKLSNADRLDAQKILEKLSQKYGDLGAKIDEATGKIKNLDEVQKKVSKKAIDEEKKDIKRALDSYRREIADLRKVRENDTFFGAIFSKGKTTADAVNAATKMNEIGTKMEQLTRRYQELNSINVGKDVDEMSKAKKADEEEKRLEEQKKKQEEQRKAEEKLRQDQKNAQEKINKNFEEELEQYKTKIKYQNLLNEGRNKEAEILLFKSRLEKKGYSEEQKNKLVEEFSKEYDLRNQRKNDQSPASQRIASNLMGKIMTFQETAQSAVLSNSVDAIRLQSRMLFNNANNPQVKLVEQGKRSVSLLERMDRTLTSMSRGGSTLSLKTV